jgi:hypothetical protein
MKNQGFMKHYNIAFPYLFWRIFWKWCFTYQPTFNCAPQGLCNHGSYWFLNVCILQWLMSWEDPLCKMFKKIYFPQNQLWKYNRKGYKSSLWYSVSNMNTNEKMLNFGAQGLIPHIPWTVLVFNTNFNNISVISWRSELGWTKRN